MDAQTQQHIYDCLWAAHGLKWPLETHSDTVKLTFIKTFVSNTQAQTGWHLDLEKCAFYTDKPSISTDKPSFIDKASLSILQTRFTTLNNQVYDPWSDKHGFNIKIGKPSLLSATRGLSG